ncbi:MAG: outer membrane beta-barrel protein [Muribaculaceae bacterium]|nr:outer membrane beta-barrel protein [Muribaculaceae bacterium]
MKKVKFLFVMTALAVSMNVAAQQGKRQVIKTTTQPKQRTTQTVARTEPQTIVTYKTMPAGWSSLYLQWNPSTFVPKKGDDLSFTGLTFGYSKAVGISETTPLFIEFGAALQYSFKSESGRDWEEKFRMFSVKVSVNLVYDWQLPNSSVSIRPFAGLTLRGNISGKEIEEDDEYKSEYDLFDKKDMDGEPFKRLQIGWQIGANVAFNNKFYLGLSYGSDFSEICKNVKISTTSITVGMYID